MQDLELWYTTPSIMQRKQSRKKELARRVFVYTLMASTVVVLLIILSMTIIGYQFNFKTRTVEQTGLVQYNSSPRGARVSVDGQNYETTQTKNTVLPGQRQFAMRLKGYENWQKTLDIQAGTVTWLTYPRLVPTEKKVTTAETIPRLTSVRTSPDRRFMAGISTNETGAPLFLLLDARDSQRPKIEQFPLDTTVLTGYGEEQPSTHVISVQEWSESNRYIILKHDYQREGEAAGHEWLWIDREAPTVVVNVSSLANLPITSMHLGEGKEAYLLQDNGDVRRIVLDSGTISRPLLANVTRFDMYDADTLAYTAEVAKQKTAGVWHKDWSEPMVITTLPAGSTQQLSIRVSRYFNKDTVAVDDGSSVTLYRGTLPRTNEALALFLQTSKSFTLNRAIDQLQISSNGRFVIAEDDQGLVSYDIERGSVSQEIKKHATGPVRWLDEYHLWQIDETGHMVMQEFDGLNPNQLLAVSSGFDTLLTQDGKYIYGFVTTAEHVVELRRLAMIAPN